MTTATVTAEKTAFLPVSPDEAFALVTEPERLRRWKAIASRVDLRAGGEYRFTVVPGHVARGTYREVVPGERIVFGWGWEGSQDLAPDASTVTVTLEPVEGGTLVRLVHEGLTQEQAASHLEGWNHFFERLERAAADGDAGPDEWSWVPQGLDELSSADAALAVLQRVLTGVTDADRDKPTPCRDFTVHQLAEHLFGTLAFVGALAGVEVRRTAQPSLESAVAEVAQQVNEAWAVRGLQGMVTAGETEMPATMAVGILNLEYLLHGWDFARATGQELRVSEEVAQYIHDLGERIIPGARAGGSFGPAVDIADRAPALDRLVALSGRTT
ncbi:TIGR03086 family metal-binding protein [Pedococcus sp. 5OH_020]|uniref:TIGR03086 family metal-binding protein n=1 Tax=Pedococcus sp. 5OH_020 TaxID=2989814 RepID=UPI0022E9BED9|nr:TIGR03086 family metal-binding protein [Pedococcus sp. 5OH_020]